MDLNGLLNSLRQVNNTCFSFELQATSNISAFSMALVLFYVTIICVFVHWIVNLFERNSFHALLTFVSSYVSHGTLTIVGIQAFNR